MPWMRRLSKSFLLLVVFAMAGFSVPAHALDPPLSPLMQSARQGNLDQVSTLLQQGADVDALDLKDKTALFYAVRENHLNVVKALLDAGANPDIAKAWPLLPVAVGNENFQMVSLLLEGGADINFTGKRSQTALFVAVNDKHSNIKLVRELIDQGADVNMGYDGRQHTSLMQAIYYGRLDIAELLLDSGAKIEAVDKSGRTVLFHAIWSTKNPISALKFLLKKGANPEAENLKGENVATLIEDMKMSYKIRKSNEGDGFQQYSLANEYRKYPRVIFNKQKVSAAYQRASETLLPLARQDNAKAQYLVGYMEFFGRGPTRDTTSGLNWMTQSGQAGYRSAQWKLGDIYANGKGGISKDKAAAIHWYELAAAQGSKSSKKALAKLKAE
ncbi:MAG: hypothetical protein COA47_09420 [Robiginitomaculum sp.]|nr:MAG: hypothetical protein COA47_09420 [Robiginitomaculum sp.]